MKRVAVRMGLTSGARRRLAEVLNIARSEDVIIKRRGGETFTVSYRERVTSPFDVPGIDTGAITQDILDAIRESRSGYRMAASDVGDAE